MAAIIWVYIVHPSLDVHTSYTIIHINLLINPLLIKKKQWIQEGIADYQETVMLSQEMDSTGNLLLID